MNQMGHPQSNYDSLIPELNEWNNGKRISVDSCLTCMDRNGHAIAYAQLVWPEFVVQSDCGLFSDSSEITFERFMGQVNGNREGLSR